MNVFPTYQSYIEPFRQLIKSLGKTDTLFHCIDDADLVKLVEEISPPCELIPIYYIHILLIMVVSLRQKPKEYPLKYLVFTICNISAAFYVARNWAWQTRFL
jgi:hypothetical protein